MLFSNQQHIFWFIKNRIVTIPNLFFLAISAAFLYFLAVRFDIDIAEIWINLRASDPRLFFLAFFLHYMNFMFRGLKWRILIGNVEGGQQTRPGIAYCGSLILVSTFVNSVTILRLGDAYRAFLNAREKGSRFSKVIGTVFAERVIDVFLMFLLLSTAFLILLTTGIGAPWIIFLSSAIIPSGLFMCLFLMKSLKGRTLGVIPKPLQRVYVRFYQGATSGFSNLPLIIGFGILGWLCEVARLFFVAEALGLTLSLPLVIFAALANAVLTLLPLGGLGFAEVGVAELLTRSLTRNAAGSVVVMDRAISYVSVIVFGGIFLLIRRFVIDNHGGLGRRIT